MPDNKTVRILALAGSTRKESLNKKLARATAAIAEEQGAEVTYVDLKDYPMPLYDGDYEAEHGLPEAARELRKLFLSHDGLIIATPEYNGSVPAVLKNTIDWLSRKQEGEPPLACFRGKVALLLGASPGGLGGIRCLGHLSVLLTGIQVMVLPGMKSVPHADKVFNVEGALVDDSLRSTLQELTQKLAAILRGCPE